MVSQTTINVLGVIGGVVLAICQAPQASMLRWALAALVATDAAAFVLPSSSSTPTRQQPHNTCHLLFSWHDTKPYRLGCLLTHTSTPLPCS